MDLSQHQTYFYISRGTYTPRKNMGCIWAVYRLYMGCIWAVWAVWAVWDLGMHGVYMYGMYGPESQWDYTGCT